MEMIGPTTIHDKRNIENNIGDHVQKERFIQKLPLIDFKN